MSEIENRIYNRLKNKYGRVKKGEKGYYVFNEENEPDKFISNNEAKIELYEHLKENYN